MAIQINDNLNPLAPKILDNRYGPYTSTTEANSVINLSFRVVGLTVGILSGDTVFSGGRYISSTEGVVEYWYYTGITDSDLVLKSDCTAQCGDPNFVDKEVLYPVDGVNKIFTLRYTPEFNSETIYYNGLLQKEGVNADYLIYGRTIEFNVAPFANSRLLASYRTYSEINFIDNEVPMGVVDGVNTVFELSLTPVEGSDHLYLNGLLQDEGDMFDYRITGKIIVFNIPPPVGSILLCSYRYN